MKSAITVICLLIPLVVIFIVIDRKDFYSGDDVADQQETVTGKKLTTVTTLKPVEKSVETNLVETAPVAKSKPAETKPAETKLIGTRPVAKAKDEGQSVPFAVPVATLDEAEKLNIEAIEYEKTRKRLHDKTVLEGKVLSISECPNPVDIDYPDCNLTLTISINDLSNSRVILIVPCIRQSQKIIQPQIVKDSLISFSIVDENSLTDQEKSIQICDDYPDFDLDYLYANRLELISSYSKISVYTKKAEDEIAYDTKLVLTEKDIDTRDRYIKMEIERLNKIIASYNIEDAIEFHDRFSEFDEDIDAKLPYAEIKYDDGTKKIFPVKVNFSVKYFLNASMSNDVDLMDHNANMIVSVNNFLKEKGISLLVVPVPLYFESYAKLFGLSKQLSTYNINRILFMKKLLLLGVETLDVEPMIEENLESPFHFYQLFKKDHHLSEMGAYYIAQSIYNHLNGYDYFKTLIKNDYSVELKFEKERILYHGEQFKDMDTISIRKNIAPTNKQSPFLLVGDSFTWTSHMQNYISHFFKTKINVISRSSSFPITTQLLQMRRSEISPSTKVCILINTSADLWQSFKEFFDEGIQLYPSKSSPDLVFCAKDIDLLQKPHSFELSLPNMLNKHNKYRLLIYTKLNDTNITYKIGVDSFPQKSFKPQVSGEVFCAEFSLSDYSSPLFIHCSASSFDGYLPKDESLLYISKVFLVEE